MAINRLIFPAVLAAVRKDSGWNDFENSGTGDMNFCGLFLNGRWLATSGCQSESGRICLRWLSIILPKPEAELAQRRLFICGKRKSNNSESSSYLEPIRTGQ
jgi:hypothetical protein